MIKSEKTLPPIKLLERFTKDLLMIEKKKRFERSMTNSKKKKNVTTNLINPVKNEIGRIRVQSFSTYTKISKILICLKR